MNKHLTCIVIALAMLAFLGGCKGKATTTSPALSPEAASEAFAKLFPEATVKSVAHAPVPGVFEVVLVDKDGRYGIVYMDGQAEHVLTGSLFELPSGENLTLETMYSLTQVDFGSIALTNSITLGAADGSRKVVVFTAPDCAPCAMFHDELKKAVQQDGDLTVYMKVIPVLSTGQNSFERARSILCSKDNATALQRLEDTFKMAKLPAPDCDAEALKHNMSLAATMKLTGMPTIIFPSGVKIAEPMSAEGFLRELDKRSGR